MRRSVSVLALVVLATSGAARADDPPIGTTTVFADVGEPGMPEGIVVRDGVVYVGTHTSIRGNAGGPPSQIFRYDLATGQQVAPPIVIEGQNLAVNHGVLMMAFDAAGFLYVVDRNPGRLLRIDVATGGQSIYAEIPNLPACRPEPVGAPGPCTPTTLDQATFADYIAFDDAGVGYVTDFESATIWRVAPGGGPGSVEIWFQDPRLDGVFGPNGIAVDAAGAKLYVAMTGSQQPGTAGQGIIYTLPLSDAPAAGDLQTFFTYLEPATGPDGIAFGASGRLYVVLAGSNQVSILEPDGTELVRFPDAVANQTQPVPYDLPASVAFDGQGSILVTHQSFFAADPDHWVVFRAWVGDTALPLREPDLS